MDGRLATAALAAAVLAAQAAPAVAVGLPEDAFRRTVVARCLPQFPAFLNAEGAVDAAAAARAAREAAGAHLIGPAGSVRFTAAQAGDPPCIVLHPGVPPATARKYVEDVLREWYAGRWSRESRAEDATVYVVTAPGATLEVVVTGHGEGADGPGAGVAFALR